MIFVTVGMHTKGFDRLIEKMDEIAGKIDEEVIMQIGSTKYKPKNARYFEFIEDFQRVQELNRKARVVVCHGGAGSIINALEQGTPVIAVPRLKRYGEAIDDHQLELVDALAEEGKIMAVHDINNLENALLDVDKSRTEINVDGGEMLTFALKRYVSELETLKGMNK